MTGYFKRGACAAIVAVMAATSVAPAMAQQRHGNRDSYMQDYYRNHKQDDDYRHWRKNRDRWSERDYDRWYRKHHRDRGNDAAAAAIFGLAAGALAGAAASGNRQPSRVRESRVPSAGGYEPFSAGYDRYCRNKYRSFDSDTGTYMGRDGNRHYCQ